MVFLCSSNGDMLRALDSTESRRSVCYDARSSHLGDEMAPPQTDLHSVEYKALNIISISCDEAETNGQFLSHCRQGVAPLISVVFQKNRGSWNSEVTKSNTIFKLG